MFGGRVAGPHDLVVVVRTQYDEQVATIVTKEILQEEGLISSETLITFRTFSKHDLERMFSIGVDLPKLTHPGEGVDTESRSWTESRTVDQAGPLGTTNSK